LKSQINLHVKIINNGDKMAKNKNIEIKGHDGPARMGEIGELKTPTIINAKTMEICPDEPMAYDVPLSLAEWSVEKTIEKAAEYKDDDKSIENAFAVVHGAKYSDLRIECAQKLEEMGYKTLLIANADELVRRPRDIAEIISDLRESISPNTTLCFPFAEASFIPIISYMGIDLFSDAICEFYSYLNIMMTPGSSYNLEKYQIYQLEQDELFEYNKRTLDLVTREVRENIKNGTLRNLVESLSCSCPQNMSLLRMLDKNHADFLEKYTPLY
jgi:predicted RNA-binding protein